MGAARQLMLAPIVDHIEEAALRRHDERPDVFAEFVSLALEAKRAGVLMGAKAVAEQLRWSRRVHKGERDFVVNNSDVACWARWAARDERELRGYFRMRERTAQ